MRKKALRSITGAALVTLALVGLLLFRGEAASGGGTDPAITAAANAAIRADCSMYLLPDGKLPSGTAVGVASTADRAKMRSAGASLVSSYATGDFLTNRLDLVNRWVDGVTSQRTDRVWDIYKTVKDVTITGAVVQSDAATVTGSYQFKVKHAAFAGDASGHIVTWGGDDTVPFTANLVQRNGRWLMSDLTLGSEHYVADESLTSGMDYIPQGTKPSVDGVEPVPVVP